MDYSKDRFSCPVEAAMFLISGKYKTRILWYLAEKPLHYMELQRMIPNATPKCFHSSCIIWKNTG